MAQSRKMSFIEAKANAVIGLIISWLFTYYGLPMFGIRPDPFQASAITACYFVLSLGRGYILRRIFNRIKESEK